MQKYVFVKFLESIAENTEFATADWPLHVTVVPRFALDAVNFKLLNEITDLLSQRKPVNCVVEDDENFGADYSIRVTVLEPKSDLSLLHKDLVKILSTHDAKFDEPEFNDDGYRAHVTIQKSGRLLKGDPVIIDEITLVDMFPDGDKSQRKVLQTIKLKN